MNITKTTKDYDFVLHIEGRIDIFTSKSLAEEINAATENKFSTLIIDFSKVDYISSTGLRVIIDTQKKINAAGLKFELTNMSAGVKSVFDMTGFSGILKIT